MRILALDYGKKRIGVAVSDPLGLTAQPLEVIGNDANFFSHLNQLLVQYQPEKVILGLPKSLSGEIKQSAQDVLAFAQVLQNKLDLKVELLDERLSTVQAERTLISLNVSRSKRKETIDKLAAALILQNYLDGMKLHEKNHPL